MADQKKILLLTGKDQYLTTKLDGTMDTHILSQVNVDRIEKLLNENFYVERHTYADLDLNRNYQEYFVIYGSTEERGLFYKSYVEDILLRLMLDGAILIPGIEYARAYGNKGFQEMLRKHFSADTINNLKSDVIGRYLDFEIDRFSVFPCVVKASTGSGSAGVKLAHTRNELARTIKKFTRSIYYDYSFTRLKDVGYMEIPRRLKIWLYGKMKKSQRTDNPKKWFYANKVVVQEYIDGLDSDYKVLYYYGKYYVLKRRNRENDFRASGSGKFNFPKRCEKIQSVLEYAEKCVKEMNIPMASLDIAVKDDKAYLIEFQCLGFGPYTLQFSEWYFERTEDGWMRIDGKSDLEIEIARSFTEYIKEVM